MIALINPNTTAATTDAMLRIARDTAGGTIRIDGFTAPFGAALITDPAALDRAVEAVQALAPKLAAARAVIVAAFGDPGLDGLRAALPVPVTGIAEAGMREAAQGRRRFAVVTTTPALRDRIAATAVRHGHAGFIGTWVTPGDPAALTADAAALFRALADGCHRAASAGAEAVIIGGGPLAEPARALSDVVSVPLIEPLPAAVRLTQLRLSQGVSR